MLTANINISFHPLTAEHIPLLIKWLKEPHVAEFWQEPEDEELFRKKYLQQLPQLSVRSYIIYIDTMPIGYIQSYEARLVGGGWWPDAKLGTFGVDQFIGDPEFIGKGYGTEILCRFVKKLFENSAVKEIITDPEPHNARAIRAYEKAGFIKIEEIKTPGGQALLMRLERR